MDFLKRHYEKVILALFLVALLSWAVILLRQVRATGEQIKEERAKTERPSGKGAPLKILTKEEFTADSLLANEASAWTLAKDKNGGTLFDPPKYIRCRNPQCFYLLPYQGESNCVYCGTWIGRVGDPPTEDGDADGIPDKVEMKYSFLNPKNPADAEADYDKDGFTNLEEYLADNDKPAMDDPKVHPAYYAKLRYLNTIRYKLPLLFTKLTKAGDDKSKWDLQFSIIENNREKTRFATIGQQVGDFSIVDIIPKSIQKLNPQTKAMESVDASEVVAQRGNEEPYTLPLKQTVFERGEKAEFVFILDPVNPRNCPRVSVVVGNEFTLTTPSGSKETYTLREVKDKTATIKLAGDPEAKPIQVQPLDPRRDFRAKRSAVPQDGTGPEDGQGPGGGPMGPGGPGGTGPMGPGGSLMPPPMMPPRR